MREGTIDRLTDRSGDAGTFSNLAVMKAGSVDIVSLQLKLGELPPRDDKTDLSCIEPMPGDAPVTYLYKFLYSPDHGCNKYTAVGVLNEDGSVGPMPGGRERCLLHSGNLCGDILLGYGAQVEGCGLVGEEFATFPKGEAFKSLTKDSPTTMVAITLKQDQPGVSASGTALIALEAELDGEDLALTYRWI